MAPDYPSGLFLPVLLAHARLARRMAATMGVATASSALHRLADELDAEYERRSAPPQEQ
jgi:hypothetical protein